MAYLPNEGRGYVVMINSGSFASLLKIGKLLRQYVTRDLPPPALPAAVLIPTEIQRHYQGYYQPISPGQQWSYGFERLLNLRLAFTTTELSTTMHGFALKRWVPMSERLFRAPDESIASVALLPDADGQVLIQRGFETFKRISGLRVWAQRIAICLITLLVLSSILLAPIWGFRKFRGRLRNPGPLSVRVWPLTGSVLLVLFDVLLVLCFRGLLTLSYIDDVSIGAPTIHTVSIMLCSIAFPVAAAAGLYIAWRKRSEVMNRVKYWYSILVGLALAATAIYYGYWGLIGLRLWG